MKTTVFSMDMDCLILGSILSAAIGAVVGPIAAYCIARVRRWYVYTRPVKKILNTIAEESQQLNLFFEVFPIGERAEIITQSIRMWAIGIGELTSVATAKCLAHVLILLRSIRSEKNIKFVDSEKFLKSDLDSNIICIGGPTTNKATRELFERKLDFPYEFERERQVRFIMSKIDESKKWYSTAQVDYGLIIRVKNPFSAGKWIFILAGLGPKGTVGAGYYLSEKIKDIAKDFDKDDQFGIVLKVEKELDYRFGTSEIDHAKLPKSPNTS